MAFLFCGSDELPTMNIDVELGEKALTRGFFPLQLILFVRWAPFSMATSAGAFAKRT